MTKESSEGRLSDGRPRLVQASARLAEGREGVPSRSQKWIRESDRGSGTVVGIGLTALVGFLTVLVVFLGSAFCARADAQNAAQQAALAGAYLVVSPGSAPSNEVCSKAQRIVEANHGRLLRCSLKASDVVVEVGIQPSVGILPQMTAWAKAGPVECVSRNG